jgi:NAD(P)-dependent dehydrogenase (short-subunit alcohol dehydrogenase family)
MLAPLCPAPARSKLVALFQSVVKSSNRPVIGTQLRGMTNSAQAAIVTGASRGLGRALAVELARRGTRVILVGRAEGALAEVEASIRGAGGEAHALVADVGDKHAVYPLAATAAALVGPIDLLVNNASELGPTPLRPLLDTECEDLERVLAVNLVGPFRLSKVIAGAMALRRRGTLLFVSSDASVNAYSGWGAYSVSKAAADHLARLLAVELGPFGVRSFSVDPGEMDTAMHRAALPDADPATLSRPEDVAARIVDLLGRELSNGARIEAGSFAA